MAGRGTYNLLSTSILRDQNARQDLGQGVREGLQVVRLPAETDALYAYFSFPAGHSVPIDARRLRGDSCGELSAKQFKYRHLHLRMSQHLDTTQVLLVVKAEQNYR